MKLILLVILLIFSPLPILSQVKQYINSDQLIDSDSLTYKSKSPKGAMLRSLIIPGWGQIYNGRYLKALVYLGGESYFISKFIELNDEFKDMEKLYEDGLENNTESGITKRSLDDKETERNGWGWLFAAGYLLAMGDAFVDAHLYGLTQSDRISFDISPLKSARSVSMQLNINF